MLSLRNLVKVYPSGTRAIDDVSLDIHRGEFVVLIGLSGSGKSSLLRCINRLIEPTAGQVIFDGTPAQLEREHVLKTAYLGGVGSRVP